MKYIFIVLLLFVNICFGNDELNNSSNSLLQNVLKELKLTENDYKKELYIEKVLPYSKEYTVMVIPKTSEQKTDEYNHYYGVFDCYIVVVNNITKRIINKFYEKEAWSSDAIVLTKIEIDTAPYILDKNIRAFGVRVYYEGSSRVNPYSQEDISLFIMEKDSIKKLLNNYPIYELHGENNGNSKGELVTKTGKLIISDKKINNLNNIIINNEIISSTYDFTNDREEKNTIKKNSKILRFNGKEYK